MSGVPDIRVRTVNAAPLRKSGAYVVYWMTAQRRLEHNFALDRAVRHARVLERPLVVFEPLRAGYRWASDRLHRFVLDGMREHRATLSKHASTLYFPYVEPRAGDGSGLLAALAKHAAVVVTDDFPCFFHPHMIAAAGKELDVALEAVDSNGLLPLASSTAAATAAHSFRRFVQRELARHLAHLPSPTPLEHLPRVTPDDLLPAIRRRWPAASDAQIGGEPGALARLPIDHAVTPADARGGAQAARARLARFLARGLERYSEDRNEPDSQAPSGLSPYLHFGHIGTHAVLAALAARERWTPAKLGTRVTGKREGFWRMSPQSEAFLEQLVTWRELGFHHCRHRPDYDRYESLPDWSRKTLAEHARDPRPHVYTLAEFEAAATHDPLWNAAQRELVRTGTIHNYMRMLWGKKILEWSQTPQSALATLIELNNKYALDGRDPNSYSGIFWTLGRFDRPFGPAQPIYGTVRRMTSQSTAKKLDVKGYLERFGAGPRQSTFAT
ncbi:MAG: deoxyribodipyrimidine photo-lyase [Planctomycetota bacterium]